MSSEYKTYQKVKIWKNGKPYGREYTYATIEKFGKGEFVMCPMGKDNEPKLCVITQEEVPEEDIDFPIDKVKLIYGPGDPDEEKAKDEKKDAPESAENPISNIPPDEDNNKLITIEQKAVITERFDAIAKQLDTRVKTAQGLVVSEDNYKDAKKIRAQIRKEAQQYADDFKAVKETVLAPWNEIETAYKEKIRNKYRDADNILKNKIDDITDGIKRERAKELGDYFNECRTLAGLDWLEARQLGIKINMSDSMKSMKEAVAEKVERIKTDCDAIMKLDEDLGAEVMEEYQRNLDFGLSMRTVKERHERMKRHEEQMQRLREEQEASRQRAERAREAAKAEDIEPPQVEPAAEEPEPAEATDKAAPKIVGATFHVSGTIDQITGLVNYMRDNSISFEQIRRK